MTAKPWMQFYPSDWKGDSKLRVCSLAARGLWLEMIAIAHEADPYGYVTINGSPITESQLARIVGSTEEEVINLISELDKAGVFSRNRNGIIYSRRMVRDEKKATKNRENGKNGGAHKHQKNKGDLNLGNPNRTQPHSENEKVANPNTNRKSTQQASETEPNILAPYTRDHIPETRNQIIDSSSKSTIGVLPSAREPAPPDPAPQRTAQPNPDDDENLKISKPPTREAIVSRIQDFPGGLRKATAEARLDGWQSMLTFEQISQGLDHCKARGFDRNGVRQYIDSLVQAEAIKKITASNAEKAASKQPKPKQDHPDWVAVCEEIISAEPEAKTWFSGDVVKQVAVNGISVTFRLGTRFLRDHVQKVYGTKIAAAWRSRNPKITEFKYEVGI